MKILPGEAPGQFLCFHPQTDQMVGLIQPRSSTKWRIELFMRLNGTATSEAEALAFANGAWAAVEAFGLLTQPKGIQDVETRQGKSVKNALHPTFQNIEPRREDQK